MVRRRRWPVWAQNRNALASDLALGRSSRSLGELASFDRPVLLVYGTETAEWLKKIIEILDGIYPNAHTVALPGDHACHIQSIDPFLEELGKHTTAG